MHMNNPTSTTGGYTNPRDIKYYRDGRLSMDWTVMTITAFSIFVLLPIAIWQSLNPLIIRFGVGVQVASIVIVAITVILGLLFTLKRCLTLNMYVYKIFKSKKINKSEIIIFREMMQIIIFGKVKIKLKNTK